MNMIRHDHIVAEPKPDAMKVPQRFGELLANGRVSEPTAPVAFVHFQMESMCLLAFEGASHSFRNLLVDARECFWLTTGILRNAVGRVKSPTIFLPFFQNRFRDGIALTERGHVRRAWLPPMWQVTKVDLQSPFGIERLECWRVRGHGTHIGLATDINTTA